MITISLYIGHSWMALAAIVLVLLIFIGRDIHDEMTQQATDKARQALGQYIQSQLDQ